MKFVVLDIGSIAPAYFSQPVIQHLRQQGHQVEILHQFDAKTCAEADLVWSEWCNEIAFEAAASGVCKKLVLRMRGYDVWFPLDQLKWENVDALVYESWTLKELAESRFPTDLIPSGRDLERGFGQVMPAGIDLNKFKWKSRGPGNVFALIARATSDKGYQLALEWARQNPQVQLQMTLAFPEQNPRLVRYLEHAAPSNVVLNGMVDTATWLDAIDANYLLLPSIWETLSYTVAEAMALGIKPLIHDFPGAKRNWPHGLVWSSFEHLADVLAAGSYDSKGYRTFVEENLDGAVQSKKFTDLLFGLIDNGTSRVPEVAPARQQPTVAQVYAVFQKALMSGDVEMAEKTAEILKAGAPADLAATAALQLAMFFYSQEDFGKSKVWAQASMAAGPRADACCLLGEIEADNEEAARDWYLLANNLPDPRSSFVVTELLEKKSERLWQFKEEVCPTFAAEPPPFFRVVVPVRNAEKWIGKCLQSVVKQREQGLGFDCTVIDDASSDGTWDEIQKVVAKDFRFKTIQNNVRSGSLFNICRTISNQSNRQPADVIVIVDGDDWLVHEDVFRTLRNEYMKGAWMTYGSWRDTSGKLAWMGAYPARVAREGLHRTVPWAGSHLKTFKRFLFDQVQPDAFKNDAGEWFTIGGDVALMIPMLEMARQRAVFIPEVLYTYNLETPDNDHKVAPLSQVKVRDLVFSRKPYERLVRP